MPPRSSSSSNSNNKNRKKILKKILNTKKTIEQIYQQISAEEHILLRPDTYIRSTQEHKEKLWVPEGSKMVYRSVTFVQGLYKIFDEILVNTFDNKQRDASMSLLKVDIDVEENKISIYNDGEGVPVEIRKGLGIYVPEMIFGNTLTSSNYDDEEKRTTAGRNGYGAKLANIFSTEFIIETCDGSKMYKQVFTNNMRMKSEPTVDKCKANEKWTRITFKPDLARFNMKSLKGDDVLKVMKKRVIEIAACFGDSVKVELDGKRIPIKSFHDYDKVEKVGDKWEVYVGLNEEGRFQQSSFVNGIATLKGVNICHKESQDSQSEAPHGENHLWVFLNALVENPNFDSQMKETLTSPKDFGTNYELSQTFVKKVANSGLVERLLSWVDTKASKELKKTDGTKTQKISGIPKLEDAYKAGGNESAECTLMLTDGDSAKAVAMAGLSVVGREKYGVFPLRGKLINVRETKKNKVSKNVEIRSIKQILGLEHGKVYDDVRSLRYGHLMIMTDQDHDGFHIKGLLINFIHFYWPSLLKLPGFLMEFITPVVKANNIRTFEVKSFYSEKEFDAWWLTLEKDQRNIWTTKFYKGLGTSSSKEAIGYFKDFERNTNDFQVLDEADEKSIDLAFNKTKVDARKEWMKNYESGTPLEPEQKPIKISDFINNKLKLFSLADLKRSIPSMVDGLKPSQRKIVFCAFTRPLFHQQVVATFCGHDFVGSNNMNLLTSDGQLAPVIPTILVNKGEGIGTGWSTSVPNYNPREVTNNVRRWINGEEMVPMVPWYKGFTGTIAEHPSKAGVYITTGTITQVNDTTVLISELPIHRWNEDYRDFLDSVMTSNEKADNTFIEDYKDSSSVTKVNIEVFLTKDNMEKAVEEGLIKIFKLTSTVKTTNMHLFDEHGKLCKYDNPLQIIKVFCEVRHEIYEKRQELLLRNLESELKKVENKIRFALEFAEGKIKLFSLEFVEGKMNVCFRKKSELFIELKEKGYVAFPSRILPGQILTSDDECPEGVDYKYLLDLGIGNLTAEMFQGLSDEKKRLEIKVAEQKLKTGKSLWMTDLDNLDLAWDHESSDNQRELQHLRKNLTIDALGLRKKY
ncbi:hypothetical protein MKW92_029737 [Papaver armeniacum]|nr:hypothetical protein MKW92_029737 [Papaver armeniacum]